MRHTFVRIPCYLFFLLALLIPEIVLAKTIYVGPSDTYKNLQSAFSAMASGDTVVLRDGTYTGSSNQIRYNQKPKSGTASAYSVIKAENPGKAVIDGQNSLTMIDPNNSISGLSYVQFDGLQFVGSDSGICGTSPTNRDAHHIKFTRCGFQSYFCTTYASYILLEDCYCTGQGRYNYIAFTSDHIVFRRCVARLDNADGAGMPIANFINYTSQGVEFQNCIAVDGNNQYYSNFNYAWSFYVRMCNTIGSTQWCSTDTHIDGSIALNTHHTSADCDATLALSGGASGTVINNSLFWDMLTPYCLANGPLSSNFTVSHSTFGRSTKTGSAVADSGSYGDISNSLFTGLNGTALSNVKSSTNNAFYGNGGTKSGISTSSGDVTSVNPLSGSPAPLKYVTRIESGTALSKVASDGGDIGATIMYQIGTSGTLYGETGYNTLTTNKIWPWPYEDTIKAFFLAYGTGGTAPPNARGFCTGTSKDGSSQSLTKYIWEYLGNQIPSDIYGATTTVQPPSGIRLVQ